MNLSSLASHALATTRSTFKGLAEAAVATGDSDSRAAAQRPAQPDAPKPEVKAAGRAEATETKPKGVRLGTVLDAYA
jgi:hypothetical protein